jgi:hypothetical protein
MVVPKQVLNPTATENENAKWKILAIHEFPLLWTLP